MAPPPPPPLPGPGPATNPHGVHFMEANGGDRFAKPVPHSFIIAMNVINTITQVLLGGVVIAAFLMANILTNGIYVFETGYYRAHIYMCVIGYMILMSQAILTFNPHAGWASTLMHPQKRTVHWILQILGSLIAISGSLLKMFDNFANFQTAHGITGFIAMLFTLLSLIAGLANLIYPTQTNTKLYKTFHGCFGTITITTAFVAIFLAFHRDLRFMFGDVNANLILSVTFGAWAGILASNCTRLVRRWNTD